MAKTPLQTSHYIVPTFTYIKTLVALSILMYLTVVLSYVQFPGGVLVNNLVAMLIAITKASLVVWVFMGIRWATKLTRLWAVAGFIVMPLMFIMFQDFFVRYHEVAPSWDVNQPGSAMPRVMDPKESAPNTGTPADGFRPRT